jgi:hypothetical protein
MFIAKNLPNNVRLILTNFKVYFFDNFIELDTRKNSWSAHSSTQNVILDMFAFFKTGNKILNSDVMGFSFFIDVDEMEGKGDPVVKMNLLFFGGAIFLMLFFLFLLFFLLFFLVLFLFDCFNCPNLFKQLCDIFVELLVLYSLHEFTCWRVQGVVLEYDTPAVDAVRFVYVKVEIEGVGCLVEIDHVEDQPSHLQDKVLRLIVVAFLKHVDVGSFGLEDGFPLFDVTEMVFAIESGAEILRGWTFQLHLI